MILFLFCDLYAQNEALSSSYLLYIEKYKDVAILHQQEYGIPASITLAQGLLESGAGASRLATEGNNHFGIKCHKSWTGDGIYHDDDKAQECFRKYASADSSYEDHARFLKRSRYSPLFSLEITDYRGWANGLSKCGYATDPRYPQKLISIIDRYELFQYDSGQEIVASRKELLGDETLEHDIDIAILDEVTMSHKIKRKWGLHYIIAHEGDTYAGIAKEFGMKQSKLLSLNDLTNDDIYPIIGSMVYLEEKQNESPGSAVTHTVIAGESLQQISQKYGIKLKKLRQLNKLSKKDIVNEGEILNLK